jgi:putative ABC transport system permease protein
VRFIPLIWMGIWRKKGRSVLLLTQIVIAFTLFGILQGLNSAVKEAVAKAHADRLYVLSRINQGEPLPLALLPTLQATAGVRAVARRSQLAGTYQNQDQFIVGIATDIRAYAQIFRETTFNSESLDALQRTRTGAIVGRGLAQKYHWKIGDRIPIQTPVPKTDGTGDWVFEIVGIYTEPEHDERDNAIFINYEYLNQSRLINRDTVDVYCVLVQDPGAAPEVSHNIDTIFANSANETHTQSETELAEMELQRIGDVDFVVHAITVAAFTALLFAAGTLMLQSVRERLPELATLKAVGFSNPLVTFLILGEAVFLCLIGAALGLLAATQVLPLAWQYIGVGIIPPRIFVLGFLLAIVLALVCGAAPAWRGQNVNTAEALSGR